MDVPEFIRSGVVTGLRQLLEVRKEKNKERTTPFGVNLNENPGNIPGCPNVSFS